MPACKMQEINAAPINGFDLGRTTDRCLSHALLISYPLLASFRLYVFLAWSVHTGVKRDVAHDCPYDRVYGLCCTCGGVVSAFDDSLNTYMVIVRI